MLGVSFVHPPLLWQSAMACRNQANTRVKIGGNAVKLPSCDLSFVSRSAEKTNFVQIQSESCSAQQHTKCDHLQWFNSRPSNVLGFTTCLKLLRICCEATWGACCYEFSRFSPQLIEAIGAGINKPLPGPAKPHRIKPRLHTPSWVLV